MKLSDKLMVIAKWLDDEQNELLVEADVNEEHLGKVAESFVLAAELIKGAAEEIAMTEVETAPMITESQLDELAKIAEELDATGDEALQKKASVLDEVLLTFAKPKDYIFTLKKAEDDRIEGLKKRYKDVKEKQDELNKTSDALKEIEKSDTYKTYRPLQTSLSTHYCPDHAGVQINRVGENKYQCALDKKIYDWNAGFTLMNGNRVPPTDVALQTKMDSTSGGPAHQIFDTRSNRLGTE